MLQARHRGLARLEAPESTGDGNDGRAVHRPAVGGDDELAFCILLDALSAFAQREPRLERLRLLHQPVDEFARKDARICRNVINRLLRVDL